MNVQGTIIGKYYSWQPVFDDIEIKCMARLIDCVICTKRARRGVVVLTYTWDQ